MSFGSVEVREVNVLLVGLMRCLVTSNVEITVISRTEFRTNRFGLLTVTAFLVVSLPAFVNWII